MPNYLFIVVKWKTLIFITLELNESSRLLLDYNIAVSLQIILSSYNCDTYKNN